jgi:lipopolysaccharide/colanic/teichoic acid biosynthesis glycosyltransferase
LTGLAQVKGYRGETPKVELMARRIDYDIRYIDTWSFWLDIKIILRTAFELVRSRRAY